MFAFKKFVSLFLEPLGLVISLFVLAWLIRWLFKARKTAMVFNLSAFALLLFFTYTPTANWLIESLEQRYQPAKISQNVQYIAVLGNGHHTKEDLATADYLYPAALKRLLTGVQLYQQHPGSKLIVSGAKMLDVQSHAQVAKQMAIELGVAEEDIIMLDAAKDTLQEIQGHKELLGEQSYLLVTSAAHMPRAMAMARGQKVNAIAAPADYLTNAFGEHKNLYTWFRSENLRKSESAMHEYIGLLWSLLKNDFSYSDYQMSPADDSAAKSHRETQQVLND